MKPVIGALLAILLTAVPCFAQGPAGPMRYNGGLNGGNDGKKPPFPGKGNGGSNADNGSGRGKN